MNHDSQISGRFTVVGILRQHLCWLLPSALERRPAALPSIQPALNGLYSMMMTPGRAPMDGVFKLSDSYDGIGAIARDPNGPGGSDRHPCSA